MNEKNWTLGDIKKNCERKSHKADKIPAQKILVEGGTRANVLLLGRPQKSRNLYTKCQ